MSRRVVTFHYILRDPEGRQLDASVGGAPVSYLEGASQIIEGLEQALRDRPVGQRLEVRVPAAKAYGERDEAQVQRVLRALLPVEGDLQPGDQFRTDADPSAPIVTVRAVEGDQVLLDANHPLAGVDLTFDVELLDARPATADELAHGHAHTKAGDCGSGSCGCA
jgi:FKBP-type peptidyl-prolyl cis-trans isomerase SlyD